MSSLTIALIFGSRNSEHDVSITSAYVIRKALKKHKEYKVIPVYISKSGKRYLEDNLDSLSKYTNFDDEAWGEVYVDMSKSDNKLHLVQSLPWFFKSSKQIMIDVVFPVLHGKAGEDGSIQGLCEMLSVPYVWPWIAAAALTIDKTISNYLLQAIGVPYIPWIPLRKWENISSVISKITFPVFVKPYNWWSTIGVSKCKDKEELNQAIEVGFYFADEILIQESIENARELNCSIAVIDGKITTTLVQQVLSNEEFLTFEEKYIFEKWWGSMSWVENKVIIPAPLPEDITLKIQEISKQVYIDFKLSGCPRIDFLYQPTTEQIYIIEINSIPGALQIYLWEKSGISKDLLLKDLIQEAIKRNTNRIGNISFPSNILENTSSFMK